MQLTQVHYTVYALTNPEGQLLAIDTDEDRARSIGRSMRKNRNRYAGLTPGYDPRIALHVLESSALPPYGEPLSMRGAVEWIEAAP